MHAAVRFLVFAVLLLPVERAFAQTEILPFEVRLETVARYDGPDWMWFHPRVVAIPSAGRDGGPAVLMTLQRHLVAEDFYSGMYTTRNDDLGATWPDPVAVPQLAWRPGANAEVIAVCDVTPGYHAPSKKVIAIGTQLAYTKEGKQLVDEPRCLQAAYSVFEVARNEWSVWRTIDLPDTDTKYWAVAPGCVQWLVQDDGAILLPMYFRGPDREQYTATVLKCAFDGDTIRYVAHGDELSLDVQRGLCEPSLVAYQGKYFLTLRNDEKGYVTTSSDGLHFAPIQPWTFDDGSDLGSYNTQQHWLAHSDGLFLIYTRRGADNDFVIRNRAPLFMAQVDPVNLRVIRATEKILMPNRGATFGNFGAAPVNAQESWVTDAEGMFGEARKRGAEGCVFNARVLWSKPNQLVR